LSEVGFLESPRVRQFLRLGAEPAL
jgi:hypothetical protein